MRPTWIILCLLLAGCGSSDVLVEGEPAPSPYSGPMQVEQHLDDPDVMRRSGAAALALECTGPVDNGGSADYDSGLASTQDTAEDAVANWFETDSYAVHPEEGYRLEREDDGRVLLSYDVAGRTKVAFIVADDVRDFDGDVGWGIESWATCNAAELPAEVTDAAGIQVWLDEDGRRVSTKTVSSYQGAEHCDWQEISFLTLGAHPRLQYVRDVQGDLDEGLVTAPYDGRAALPSDATDTGFRRDGEQLWLVTGKAAYLVDADDPSKVERWPVAKERILCA